MRLYDTGRQQTLAAGIRQSFVEPLEESAKFEDAGHTKAPLRSLVQFVRIGMSAQHPQQVLHLSAQSTSLFNLRIWKY